VPCGTPAPPPPDYSDVISPRLGVELEVAAHPVDLTLRGGYAFVPTPVPEQTGLGNAFDATRHGFALGYRVAFAGHVLPLHFEGALRFDWLAPRTHEKESAEAAESLGPVVTTHGNVVSWVFGVGVDL
jgi:long-chain fatty acid transport protein